VKRIGFFFLMVAVPFCLGAEFASMDFEKSLLENPLSRKFDFTTGRFRKNVDDEHLRKELEKTDQEINEIKKESRKLFEENSLSIGKFKDENFWKRKKQIDEREKSINKKRSELQKALSSEENTTEAAILPEILSITRETLGSETVDGQILLNWLPLPSSKGNPAWGVNPLQMFFWTKQAADVEKYLLRTYESVFLFPRSRNPILFKKKTFPGAKK